LGYKNRIDIMEPILEINEFPIREFKICVGCWTWCGHKDTWCNNVDEYSICSYIDTPKSELEETYGLLRTSKNLLFEMIILEDKNGIIKIKKIITELKSLISFYETYI